MIDRPDREPDIETENFRMWTEKAEKQTKENEEEYKNNLIRYKDIELSLCGFNMVRNKETKEIVLAYKIKNDNGLLFYFNDKYSEVKEEMMVFLKLLKDTFNYNIIDMKDMLENLNVQKHLLSKDLKKKENKK